MNILKKPWFIPIVLTSHHNRSWTAVYVRKADKGGSLAGTGNSFTIRDDL